MESIIDALVETKEVTYPVIAFVVAGLTQALKKSFPLVKQHAELVAPMIGLTLGLIVATVQGDFLTHGLLGVTAGLAGCGIFDLMKKEKRGSYDKTANRFKAH